MKSFPLITKKKEYDRMNPLFAFEGKEKEMYASGKERRSKIKNEKKLMSIISLYI
jgi:hypothetical protein